MKIKAKYRKIAEIYRIFLPKNLQKTLDFSEKSLVQMFNYESKGITLGDMSGNGFYHGKKWLDLTVSTWIQDIKDGLLMIEELYADKFPHWWLDRVLKNAKIH